MTTLSEIDVITTSPHTEIKFKAPRIQDREMIEEIQRLITLVGVKNTIEYLKGCNDALSLGKTGIHVKLNSPYD